MAELLGVAVVVIGSWWTLLFLGQRSLMYPAPPAIRVAAPPPGGEPHWLGTPAGRVEAWYLPPHDSPGGRPAPLLLFAHGNAEVIDWLPAEFDDARAMGYAVLMVEYPGYGRSEGRPSEASISAAMLAAYDWAAGRPDVDADRIVAWGRSLGSGAACSLIGERPLAALVLEAAFTSARAFAIRYGAPGFLVRDPFDNLARLRRYDGPVLLLHGVRDRVIPVRHSRALAAAVPGAELHELPCDHNDCPPAWPLVRAFLARNEPGPR